MLHNIALSAFQNTTLPIKGSDIKNKNYVGMFGKIIGNSKKPSISLSKKEADDNISERFKDSLISTAVGLGVGAATYNKMKPGFGNTRALIGGFGTGIAARQGTQWMFNKLKPELYDPVSVSSDLAWKKFS